MSTKHLKQLVFFIFVSLLPLSQTWASPKLVVFFIHGIQSDPSTFGDFPEVLQEQIEDRLGNGSFLTKSLQYSTNNNEWGSTKDFAVEISAQIDQFYQTQKISRRTPYAFVSHSQGGLVVNKYIQNCLYENSCLGNLPQNLKHFISIGTPYHGSSASNFLMRGIEGLFGESGFFLRLFGEPEQSVSLAVGSTTLAEDRLFTINNHRSLRSKIKFHNILGVTDFDNYTLFNRFSLGREIESDMVVSTTSARRDFHHCVMDSPQSRLRCGTTNLVKQDNIYIVENQHSPLPFSGKLPDMKEIHRGTPHPTLDIVRKILLTQFFGLPNDDTHTQRAKQLSHALKNFAVDLHIYFPEEMERGPKPGSTKISYRRSDFIDIKSFLIKGGALHQYKGFNDHSFELLAPTVHKNSLSFFHIGKIENPAHWALFQKGVLQPGHIVKKHWYRIEHPGFEPVEFEIPVSAVMTSYAKIYMKPIREFTTPSHRASNIQALSLRRSLQPLRSTSIEQKYNYSFNPEAFYSRPQINPILKKYRELGACALGVIAPVYRHGVAMEPVRYRHFSEASRNPMMAIEDKWLLQKNYQKRLNRHVRIHGSFSNSKTHRYLVSQPKMRGVNVFWIDAEDIDLLTDEDLKQLGRENQDIHKVGACSRQL